MKFIVEKDFFEKVPNAYFGVVVVKGFDNKKNISFINDFFNESMEECRKKFDGVKVKESELITPYRDAFTKLGINPNKYMCSIEALITRIAKGNSIPSISPIVDLCNALSLKYILPIGAHDIDNFKGDIEIRRANENDIFVPFNSEEFEHPDLDEIIYVSGNEVKTRRWTWRQGEKSKLTENSTNLFIPIDGFIETKEKVEALKSELVSFLESQGFEVTYLNVDEKGFINLNELRQAITDKTALISIMFANNEIGTIEPIEEIAEIAKQRGIIFHTDAVQAVGNTKIDVGKMKIDMLSLSGHKIYGPKGIGALYVKENIQFEKFINGGHQERDKRAGTENTAGIVGLGKACQLANNDIENQLLCTDKWTNNSAVWRNLYSFNNNECITHGGAHFLEVVIPFITIKKK